MKSQIMKDTKRISFQTIQTADEVQQLLQLQESNHYSLISTEQASSQGFVTVRHDTKLIEEMNNAAPQIIAKDGEKVIAYALVMLKSFQDMIPVLKPMFDLLKTLSYKDRELEQWNYYVMGQICIADGYRGIGIVDKLYQKHKELYSSQFELCITEVSVRNIRSMKAHERVGFKTIHTFKDQTDEWNILAWDWK